MSKKRVLQVVSSILGLFFGTVVWGSDVQESKKIPLKELAPDSRYPSQVTPSLSREPASVEAKKVAPDASAPADDGKWVPLLKYPGRRN